MDICELCQKAAIPLYNVNSCDGINAYLPGYLSIKLERPSPTLDKDLPHEERGGCVGFCMFNCSSHLKVAN